MNLKKEFPLLLIVLIPFVYLAYIWGQLPDQVPLQWGIDGNISRFGSKMTLWLIPVVLPLLIYGIFWVVPKIDPKEKIKNMGNKYNSLKFLLVTFMSGLALYIIYTAQHQSDFASPNFHLVLGILFVILGNYFKTIRPNYFIGIKTPWTLENETNWKETHTMAGKLWLVGGIFVILANLFLAKYLSLIVFFVVLGIIIIVPVVYSYLLFRKDKSKEIEMS